LQTPEGQRLRLQRRGGPHPNARPQPDLHAQVGQKEDGQLRRRHGDAEEEERGELLAPAKILMLIWESKESECRWLQGRESPNGEHQELKHSSKLYNNIVFKRSKGRGPKNSDADQG